MPPFFPKKAAQICIITPNMTLSDRMALSYGDESSSHYHPLCGTDSMASDSINLTLMKKLL
jgi:hypothetical protein